jgi:HEAT repeat
VVAVTDSIAWNVLPKPLFQRLFRQDLLVASMFRNFLLADRILRSFGCTPVSYPPLPGIGTDYWTDHSNSSMADHPLWHSWDLACETMLFQLLKDGILTNSPSPVSPSGEGPEPGWERTSIPAGANQQAPTASQEVMHQSISSPFFSEQLTAFEIWLDLAPVHKMQAIRNRCNNPESPEQLAVVLQVLLSPVNRLRALKLLQRFLDLGPWAVNQSLSLGIYPYVMKLLQSPEYKSLLVRIWASILAFDTSCRIDVLRDGAMHHFLQHLLFGLTPGNNGILVQNDVGLDAARAANERTLAAFVVAAILHEYSTGQVECVRLNMHYNCCTLLASLESETINAQQQDVKVSSSSQPRSPGAVVVDSSVVDNENDPSTVQQNFPPHFRLWICLCMGNLVKDNIPIQNEAFSAGFKQRLESRLRDQNPEVRAAACYALGALAGSHAKRDSRSTSILDLASLQLSQGQPPNVSLAAPNGPGFALNPNLSPSTPTNFIVPGGVTLGVGQMTTAQLQPSFTLASANHVTTLSTAHLPQLQSQPLQSIAPSAIQVTQGNQAMFQRQLQLQPQQHQPFLPNFLSHPTQQGQIMLQPPQQQPMMQGLPYMLQPNLNQAQSQFAASSHQFQQPLVTGGFLMAPGSGLPVVLPQQQAPLVGVPLNHAMPYQSTPQFSSTTLLDQSRRMMERPNSFEVNRLDLDLSCAELLLGAVLHDGSVVVRYEVAVALGAIVGKYLEAFIVVAEELSRSADAASQFLTSTAVPPGLDPSKLDRLRPIWQAVRELKRDPFPPVNRAATAIISYVFDALLKLRLETEKQHEELSVKMKRQGNGLAGIDEEPTSESSSMMRSTGPSSASRGNSNQGNILRRVVSEGTSNAAGNLLSMEAVARKPESQVANSNKDIGGVTANSYTLPKSELYEWKKGVFDSSFSPSDHQDADPLSPAGAARSYRDRRNFVVHENGTKVARRYSSLAPKPPEPQKKSFELMFEKEDESALLAAEEEARAKKGELEMTEKRLFRNDGVMMTALINFHPYEDYLMACGATDSVTLWDTESGKRLKKFENGNPDGSRMTSSFWINEESLSLFLVGSDDGIVKVRML